MPELPDVEAHRRTFAAHAVGRPVRGVTVPDPGVLDGTTPQGLGRALSGREFAEPGRHGKWLLAGTADGGPTLALHFRMTGDLAWTDDGAVDDDDAVVIRFDDGALHVRTVRRFTRVLLVPGGEDPLDRVGPLGPDAWKMDRATFDDVLDGRRGGLKSALMDQTLIAGLGNELVDDLLFRARLHPRTPVPELSSQRRDALWSAMREVLRRSVRAGHVPSGPTWINGRRGADDPRCPEGDAPLERATVAGRTTYWCPRHQPHPDG